MSDILRDSGKKNEIPKVKIPKFSTGGICSDAIFPKLDVFSQIDEIVKDIRDRQDNAMAMEFTKCIGELLRKNGVVPKLTEYRAENHEENFLRSKYEVRFGVSIDELDFSEHDKVFEDKIAELEKRIRELDIIDAMRIDEKRELKQRIAELESKNDQLTESILRKETKIHELKSKETEKTTKINLNDRVKVKLTPLGVEIYYHQYDDLNKKIKENGGTQLEPRMPQIDKDGYTEFTLWSFMELYGKHIGMCKPNVILPLNIIISE